MAYTTLVEMRAMEGLDDDTVFPDATVNAAIALAELEIDIYTMTSWTYKAFTATLTGRGGRCINVVDDEGYPILYLRTISSATVDGDAVTPVSGWKLYPSGKIISDEADFGWDDQGRNVVLVGTAGFSDTAPADIQWACRKLARWHLLTDISRINEQALAVDSDFGTINLAQASNAAERPTSLPEVNARLARRRQSSRSAYG